MYRKFDVTEFFLHSVFFNELNTVKKQKARTALDVTVQHC
jgi:hypothetical protein